MSVTLSGIGLHTGRPSRVTFSAQPGPVELWSDSFGGAAISAFQVTGTLRSTTITSENSRIRATTVEHCFAALGAHGLHHGVRIHLWGPEFPLLDGGAVAFGSALRELDLPRSESSLFVARDGEIVVGESRFVFSRSEQTNMEVEVDYGDPRLAKHAVWEGDAADFDDRIAPARTFAFERDLTLLQTEHLARHVDPASVVFISSTIHVQDRPFAADEPARHKLLDLIGDAYLHGGPPVGRVAAFRPGHSANHAAFTRAIELGLLARTSKQ